MKRVLLYSLMFLIITGCTTTQKGAVIGGASGAGLGGIIGHQSGHGGQGAAIGGAVGAVAGGLIGNAMKKKFCPVCGVTYDESIVYCPKDGTELKFKQ